MGLALSASMNTVHFKKRLLARRSELLGDVRQLEKEETEIAAAETGISIHSAEKASDATSQDVSLGCLESVTREIQDIDAALERIQTGGYGICEGCDQKIPEARLEAIPYARFCLGCKSTQEHS